MPAAPEYRVALRDAIARWLPPRSFARWALRRGLTWTPQRLTWTALMMAWDAAATLAARFDAARDVLAAAAPTWRLGTSYPGFLRAWMAWAPRLIPALVAALRRAALTHAGRHATRCGWAAFVVDGSRIDAPRTAANEAALGCAGKRRTAPQLFLTMLWHMGTGLPWDYRIGPGTASERRHLEDMLPDLPADALIVADAGFAGFDTCRRILESGRSFLLRVGSNVHLLKGLGYAIDERDRTAYLWPHDRRDRPPLVLRLIVLARGRRSIHLLTDVLSEPALSDEAAGALYQSRWGGEVWFRSFKQTLGRRKLLSRTPAAARAELGWSVVGLWLVSLIGVVGILERGGDPLRFSVAVARDRLRVTLRRSLGRRRARPLAAELAEAVRDGYERRRPKRARSWPHKKRDKPPGAPKVVPATPQLIQRAQRLQAQLTAA